MKKSVLVSVSLGITFMFSGCATLFGGGSTQKIAVHTNKPMIVEIGHTKDNENIIDPQTIEAPSIVTVNRENKDILVKTKDGKRKIIKKKLNSWLLGDVLSTDPLSTTTDLATGAAWKYDDNVNIDSKQ